MPAEDWNTVESVKALTNIAEEIAKLREAVVFLQEKPPPRLARE